MALKRGTSFTGVPVTQTRVGAVVRAGLLDTVAADQAYDFERLTNKNADTVGGGGALTVNTAHDHTEDGNKLAFPFFNQHFGHGSVEETGLGASPLTTNPTYGEPYTISSSGSNDVMPGFELFCALVPVPAAWVDEDIAIYVRGQWFSDPRIYCQVYDDTSTIVESVPLADGEFPDGARDPGEEGTFANWCGSTFQVSAAGVYYVVFMTDIKAEVELRIIKSAHILPWMDVQKRDMPKAAIPGLGATNAATVPSWQPIDGALTTANEALGAAVLLLTQNQNAVYEKATGLPAPGNITITETDPHNHDGTNSIGVDYPVCSVSFGSVIYDSTNDVPRGHFSRAPRATDTTLASVAQLYVRTQKSSNNVAATSKLKVAILVDNEAAKTGVLEAQIGNGTGDVVQCYASAGSGKRVVYRTGGSTALGFTTGGYTSLLMQIRSSVLAPTAAPKLLAFAAWHEQ